jgi:hypothetical protein
MGEGIAAGMNHVEVLFVPELPRAWLVFVAGRRFSMDPSSPVRTGLRGGRGCPAAQYATGLQILGRRISLSKKGQSCNSVADQGVRVNDSKHIQESALS